MKKYVNYIYITIIVILIIIIGFMYGNNTTEKVEQEQIEVTEEKVENPKIMVDIKGEVNNPGVYELNNNERINDVIKKAGGLTEEANTDYINLSKIVKDQMVIIIYSKKEVEEYQKSLIEKPKEIIKYQIIEKEIPCPNTTNDACVKENITTNNETIKKNNKKEESDETVEIEQSNNIETNESNKEKININTASKEELMTITGIGESKANLIIDYRNNESFKDIEDIKNVKSIGESLFEKIKDYITV